MITVRLRNFRCKELGTKATCKMLVKLTTAELFFVVVKHPQTQTYCLGLCKHLSFSENTLNCLMYFWQLKLTTFFGHEIFYKLIRWKLFVFKLNFENNAKNHESEKQYKKKMSKFLDDTKFSAPFLLYSSLLKFYAFCQYGVESTIDKIE